MLKFKSFRLRRIVLLFLMILIVPALGSGKKPDFEFHGIRSGMSKQEFINALGYEKLKNNYEFWMEKRGPRALKKTDDEKVQAMLDGMFLPELLGWGKRAFKAFIPYWTDEGKLWKLEIAFQKPVDPLKIVALERILNEEFGQFIIVEFSSSLHKDYRIDGPYWGNGSYYIVKMVSLTVFENEVEKFSEEYRSGM